MKKHKADKIGPGIKLYSSGQGKNQETLYRATTGQYFLETTARRSLSNRRLIEESEAIAWCEQSGHCQSDADFFDKVWALQSSPPENCTIISVPIPQNTSSFGRVLELLQLPAFRVAAVRSPKKTLLEYVWLEELDYLAVCAWTSLLTTVESHDYGRVIPIGADESFTRINSNSKAHEYVAALSLGSIRARCGYALAPFQFPKAFQSVTPLQGVWIDLLECPKDIDDVGLARIVESAIGVLFSAILMYEVIMFISKDPTQIPPDNAMAISE